MQFDYPATVKFLCTKCGICCGDTKEKTRHVLLLKTEVEQISKATLQPTTQFAVKIKDAEPYCFEMKKKAEDGKCIFLNTLTWDDPERCEPIINSLNLKNTRQSHNQ